MIQLTPAMNIKLPKVGLRLETSYSYYKGFINRVSNRTNANLCHIVKCEYCGVLSIKNFTSKKQKPRIITALKKPKIKPNNLSI